MPLNGESEWRPRHHELWLGLSWKGFAVWEPAADPLRGDVNLTPIQLTFASDGRNSMFTHDGKHWLSAKNPMVGNLVEPTMYVGSADDITRPLLQLHPQAQEFESLWETSDGRLLVGSSSFRDRDRQDVYLVDPDTGSSRGIASGGHLVALGHTRALALLNWQTSSSTGDLTLIDLETGAKTQVAQDVYNVAVDPELSADGPWDADRLAPGTAIAFLTRNRLASPYDGLWVARLP